MRLIDDLEREHVLIEQVAGALRAYVASPNANHAERAHFVDFFRLYAGNFHHAREEDALFHALVEQASLPGDHGPLAALRRDHEQLAEMLSEFAQSGDATVANAFADRLLLHIDAERSVLFPEGRERLRRVGVCELGARTASGEELAALARGAEVVERYPPRENPELVRGDGCVVCPSFGRACDGLERAWWTESEWDELPDRHSDG